MKIIDLLKTEGVKISYEFFPPKTGEEVERLMATVSELKELNPVYVSVTYGAGGSTRERTLEVVKRIHSELGITVMAHLTGMCHTRGEIIQILDKLQKAGIENILALRGDYPKDNAELKPRGDFKFGSDLVRLIRSNYKDKFCIGVAGYPEKHPEAPDMESDIKALKHKIDAGADFIITQLYFDNKDYFSFVRLSGRAGISVPIIPGIMPITNLKQIKRFTEMCGAKLPGRLLAELESVSDNMEEVKLIGIRQALMQCKELILKKVPGIHFYTLNKSTTAQAIVYELQKGFPRKPPHQIVNTIN